MIRDIKCRPPSFFIFLVTSFIYISSYSQNTKLDTNIIDELYKSSKKYWRSNTDSSLILLKRANELSKKIKYKRGEAYSIYGIAINNVVLYQQFKLFISALDKFENLHDNMGISLVLLQMGRIYNLIGLKEKALFYYQESLRLKRKLNDYGGMALCLITIGQYYIEKKEYISGMVYFEQSLIYRLKDGKAQGIAYSQINIGETFFQLKKYPLSLQASDSALTNFNKTNDYIGQIWALNLKARSFQKLHEDKAAIKIFEKIINYPGVWLGDSHVLYAMKAIIDFSIANGELKKASELQNTYIKTLDMMMERDTKSETQRLINEYEFKKAEQNENTEKVIAQKKINKRYNLEYLGMSIFLLAIFVFLFSGKLKISHSWTERFVLLGMLLFFEFLLVLTDPLVENITQGEPVWKLLSNVFLALGILPIHNFIEKFMHKRLVSNNNH